MNAYTSIGRMGDGTDAGPAVAPVLGSCLGRVAFVKAIIQLILVGTVAVSVVPVDVQFRHGRRRAPVATNGS